jgi:hypothetical protein
MGHQRTAIFARPPLIVSNEIQAGTEQRKSIETRMLWDELDLARGRLILRQAVSELKLQQQRVTKRGM